VSSGPFDLQPRTRVVFGAGSLARLGELAVELGARRVLLVTDAHIVAAGHADRAEDSLDTLGLAVARYAGARENPTTVDAEACRDALDEHAADLVVAVGGGSSIDTAKGGNFLHSCGGRMEDYWGVGTATSPLLPMIAVPTTAGTGSEVQSFALIAQEAGHQKMACGDPSCAPRVALLDPDLTRTAPALVTAHTGLDALTHAVETAVTTKRNAASRLYAREAFRLAERALPRVLADRADDEARGDMLLAATWAGLAIEHSMLGAAHSLANPLTAHFDVPHGQAVGMMLPHVVRYNGALPEARAQYAHLVHVEDARAADVLAARVEELLDAAALPRSIEHFGVGEDDLASLAREAAGQWTARFNPRPVAADDLRGLYRAALAR
jgi:alcohol dehydrogenase